MPFLPLELNKDRSASQPTMRLWGIDDNGKRAVILAAQIQPYFYYLPDEKDNPDSIRDRLMNARGEFQKINCEDAETKKLVGQARSVLKVT